MGRLLEEGVIEEQEEPLLCLAARLNISCSQNKDERFVSRYIVNAIYCINWKYRDIAIIRIYHDILTIFFID